MGAHQSPSAASAPSSDVVVGAMLRLHNPDDATQGRTTFACTWCQKKRSTFKIVEVQPQLIIARCQACGGAHGFEFQQQQVGSPRVEGLPMIVQP